MGRESFDGRYITIQNRNHPELGEEIIYNSNDSLSTIDYQDISKDWGLLETIAKTAVEKLIRLGETNG